MSGERRGIRAVLGFLLVAAVVAGVVVLARRRGVRPTLAGVAGLARGGADRAVATWRGLVGGERVTDEDLERLFGEQSQG
ncbi:MAG: hypothetical protein RL283_1270 [Actinomycetota bacterium]|jgi:hypothetical protein